MVGAVVATGGIAALSALRWMDWARRDDAFGRTTFTSGPSRLLAVALASSIALAVLVVAGRRPAHRLLLVIATLVAAGAAVATAMSRIASANRVPGTGASRTAFQPGAGIAVLAAMAMVVAALLGWQLARRVRAA